MTPLAAHDFGMELTLELSRIDWEATGLLAAMAFAVAVMVFVLLRRGPPPPPAVQPPRPFEVGMQQFVRGINQEMEELRAELAALRDEVAQLKVQRGMGPQYNEAMTLAGRGVDAARIAEHCGISVGEAELVCALVQRGGAQG
jgi:hypothetical protein